MESELISEAEIGHVKALMARVEDPNDVRGFDRDEMRYVGNLLTRVANQAKATNDQCNRTIKLLRLILKDVL